MQPPSVRNWPFRSAESVRVCVYLHLYMRVFGCLFEFVVVVGQRVIILITMHTHTTHTHTRKKHGVNYIVKRVNDRMKINELN